MAIKKITDAFADLVDAKRILREIKLLRHFDGHENVIKILDILTMPPNTVDFVDIYIVTDLMESDLDRIISSSQPLTEQHFQYFIYQILRGMKYIHSANVLVSTFAGNAFLFVPDSDCLVSVRDLTAP